MRFKKALDSPVLTTWVAQLTGPLRFVVLTPLILKLDEVQVAVFFSLSMIDVIGNLVAGRIRRPATQVLSGLYNGASSFHVEQARAQAQAGLLGSAPNWSKFCKAVAALRKIQGLAGLGGAFIGSIVTGLAVHSLVGGNDSMLVYGSVVVLTGLNVFYKMLVNPYVAALHSVRKVAVTAKVQTVGSLSGMLAGAATLLMGGGILALVLADVIVQIVTRTVLRHLALYYVEPLRNSQSVSNGEVQDFWHAVKQPVTRGFASAVMSSGVSRVSVLMFASPGNAGALASFLLARRFLDQVGNLGDFAIQSKLPCFTSIFLSGKSSDLRGEAVKLLTLTLGVLIAGVLVISLFAESLLKVTGSNVKWLDPIDWIILVSIFVITRIGQQFETLYQLTNEFPFFRRDFIAGVIVLISVPFAAATNDLTWVIIALLAPYPLVKEGFQVRKALSIM